MVLWVLVVSVAPLYIFNLNKSHRVSEAQTTMGMTTIHFDRPSCVMRMGTPLLGWELPQKNVPEAFS